MQKIKVSVLCLTYNQKDYIRQCLDSLLMQETNFNFEVLVNDDASTDETVNILREYQKKYPKIVKPIFQKENQYSKGKRNFILRYLLPKSRGDYIALCEGDDYWTDPNKLQKQVDFLENNKDHSLCFHPVRVIYENINKEEIFPDTNFTGSYTALELLKWNFIQTNSVMYRKMESYKDINYDVAPGDWYLHLIHAHEGKIGFINEAMSVYRRHEDGVWWSAASKNRDSFWIQQAIYYIKLCRELTKLFNNKEEIDKINFHMDEAINGLLKSKNKESTKIFTEVCIKFPGVIEDYSKRLLNNNIKLNKDIEYISNVKKDEKEHLDSQIKKKDEQILELSKELEDIKHTKAYKISDRLKKLRR